MRPKLIITGETEPEREYSLSDSREYVLGRDQNADVPLPERRISRKHALIHWNEEESKLTIEDQGSLNGTFVNSRAVKRSAELKHGDEIRIGGYSLIVDWPREHISGIDYSSVMDLEPVQTHPDSGNSSDAEVAFERLTASTANEETGGRLISGRLQELSLPDVLQMLATTRKSGVLVLSSEKLLRIPSDHAQAGADLVYIKAGEILDARSEDLDGREAFYQLLEREEGYFALFPLAANAEPESKIDIPLEMLLLDGLRKLDERKAENELSGEDILDPQLDQPLTQLEADELAIFQLAWKHHQVSKIIEKASESPIEVEAKLKKLIRNGFLKKSKK